MTMDITALQSAHLQSDGNVEITWKDAHRARFHGIWLRHSPGFPGFGTPAGPDGRFLRPTKTISPAHVDLTDNGDLRVAWNDGSISEHDAEWLRQQDYGEHAYSKARRPIETWDGDGVRAHTEFTFPALDADEDARLPLFEHLLDHGVALLRDVPTKPYTLLRVGGWLGQMPANLYADDPGQPTVRSVRIDPNVPVATGMYHFLGPHTDTCWRQTLSGLVLLHCLKSHPDGGRSIVVDGFAVAERLRAQDPAAFELLARIPLDFRSKVADRDDWRVMGRILSVAADGTLEGVRYNGNSIGQLQLPANLVEPVYAALETFESILYDRSFWWQPQLQPGDLLVLDNHRVLHGREEFDPGAGERHLQTCAVDRDDFHNRYRRLARKLELPGAHQRLNAGVI